MPETIRKRVDILLDTKQNAQNFYEEFLETFRVHREGDGVSEPVIGSVLWHDLADAFSHTGIYVGGGQIVHLTGKFNGSCIEKCTSQGFSGGKIIFVSCQGTRAVGNFDIAQRALSLVGQARDYHLFKNNCHGFITECLGKSAEDMIAQTLKMDCWRVWVQ